MHSARKPILPPPPTRTRTFMLVRSRKAAHYIKERVLGRKILLKE
jgi:hypothetical protein